MLGRVDLSERPLASTASVRPPAAEGPTVRGGVDPSGQSGDHREADPGQRTRPAARRSGGRKGVHLPRADDRHGDLVGAARLSSIGCRANSAGRGYHRGIGRIARAVSSHDHADAASLRQRSSSPDRVGPRDEHEAIFSATRGPTPGTSRRVDSEASSTFVRPSRIDPGVIDTSSGPDARHHRQAEQVEQTPGRRPKGRAGASCPRRSAPGEGLADRRLRSAACAISTRPIDAREDEADLAASVFLVEASSPRASAFGDRALGASVGQAEALEERGRGGPSPPGLIPSQTFSQARLRPPSPTATASPC